MKAVAPSSLAVALMAIGACSNGGPPGTQPQDPTALVIVTPAVDTVLVGDSVPYVVFTRDSQPVNGWTVSDSRVARIEKQTGFTALVHALHQGVTTVTAARGDSTASAALVVQQAVPVSSVTVTPSVDTVVLGNSAIFTATLWDAQGNPTCCQPVTWTVGDTGVAQIISTGGGTATLRSWRTGSTAVAATSAGLSGSAQMVVKAVPPPGPVVSVTVAPAAATVTVGLCAKFVATLRDAQGTIAGGPVAWTLGDTSLAYIVSGLVAIFQKQNPCHSLAYPYPSGVLIVGKKPGSTLLTAMSAGKTGTAQLTFIPPLAPASVTLAPATDTVVVGESGVRFTATLLDAQGYPLGGPSLTYYPLTWALGDTSVARILSTTLQTAAIQALKVGSVVLTATSNGKSAFAHVAVEAVVPVATVTVRPASGTVVAGNTTVTFTATLWDALGRPLAGWALDGHPLTWVLSDTSVARIVSTNAQTAVIQGSKVGSAVLTATTGAQSGTAQVVVSPPVASVTVVPGIDTLTVGDSAAFTATPRDALGNPLSDRPVTWSADTMVARIVPASGQTAWVRAVRSGSAVLTATSEAKSGTASLVVR